MTDTVLLILNIISLCLCASHRDSFNPSGAEYEGKSGQFNYAIFASVAVTHSRAAELCEAFYEDGRLAWLGDTTPQSLRNVIEQARFLHDMNYNNFYWIDGQCPWGETCSAQQERCHWVAQSSSYVEPEAKGNFCSVGIVVHEVRSLNATDAPEDGQLWPALLFDTTKEVGSPEAYKIASAPGYIKAGFICAYSWDPDDCPVGYVEVSGLAIPNELVPKKVTTKDVCN